MPQGRPKRDEPTCVLAVRVPVALRDALDRSLEALETRVGLKASRNEIIRHALRLLLETQQPAGQPPLPQRLSEP
jgi:metal-responsive CopG/Arc/MetJ family transcriptional regulator